MGVWSSLNMRRKAESSPLFRALFDLDLEGRDSVTVTGILGEDRVFSVTVE